MTKNKAQKQAVRARMDKTGERYTTARHYLLDRHHRDDAAPAAADADPGHDDRDGETSATAAANPPAPVGQPAANDASAADAGWIADPGMNDATLQKATGKGWPEWIALLDAWQGATHTHTEIARHVHETYGIDGWWAQNVTVGYERARGMRALHQRPDGFSMSVSKTFPVPVERLFAAFVEPDQRARWLDGIALRNRTSRPPKSARFDVLPGETRLAVNFIPRGPEKAVAQLQQDHLADAADVARCKALWQAQLARLADVLAAEPEPR